MGDYTYINEKGTIVPDTSTVLTDVQNEFKNAFGQDLIVDPSTPQGVLITSETTSRISVINNNAMLANQINPNISEGIFLDAVCALTGLERDAATPTTVSATLTGVATTVITEGTRAQTQAGDVFETTGEVTIGGGGTVTANFQSVDMGPIPCDIGDLSQIVDGVIGWETISNPAAATAGTNTQSDQSLRALRKVTLALQGVSLPEAIISRLYATPGVKSLTFRENIEASTQIIDGVSMVEHSIYACVDGGTNLDVATSLLSAKSGGCNWNGATTVNVEEPYSGQEYAVKFDRPTAVPVRVRATVSVSSSLIDPQTAVPAAIMAYVNGEIEGEQGLIVGQDVSVFELAGAVNTQYPGIYVSNLEIAEITTDAPDWVTVIEIAIDQIATLEENDIQVIVE
jgi:hypothetical protein